MMEDAPCTARIGNPLRTHIHLITVFEQTTAQRVAVVLESRVINTPPFLELEVRPHTQLLVVAVSHTHTNGIGEFEAVGDGIGGRIMLGNGRIRGDDATIGVCTELMARTEHSTDGEFIIDTERQSVLNAKVELVTADGAVILLIERVDG